MLSLEQVREVFLGQKRPLSFITLARSLNIRPYQNRNLTTILEQLQNLNEIGKTRSGQYFKYRFCGEGDGIFKGNWKGFGFVDFVDSEQSLFFTIDDKKNALDGDHIQYKIYVNPIYSDQKNGLVVKILKRETPFLIGRVYQYKGQNSFFAIGFKMDYFFTFVKQYPNVVNHYVKAKIVNVYKQSIALEIVEDFGLAEQPHVDIDMLVAGANISDKFSDEVIDSLTTIPLTISPVELKSRLDLRKEIVFTIDGADSKDLDDAISIKKLPNNNYQLSVHIADVSHYVKENSLLDKSALERGTSIYLLDRVIPMLPPLLSDNLCSLHPNTDKLTISAIMEIDQTGKTVNVKIAPSIINSTYRLTYEWVNQFYKDNKDDQKTDHQLKLALENSLELSEILGKFKVSEGYVDFEIEEPILVTNDKNQIINIKHHEVGIAEKMIENFMVKANETVANFISKKELPFIYRVHDKPALEKVEELKSMLAILKINVAVPKFKSSLAFVSFVTKLKEVQFDSLIKNSLLRIMSKAIYTKNNIGHFGLASTNYTHFTSPIRRYPDLMVHRMLRQYLFEHHLDQAKHFNKILEPIAAHSTQTEINAQILERKVNDFKKTEYYQKFINQKLVGKIISIKKFGLFVEFPDLVNGLIHHSTLVDGEYSLASNGMQMYSDKCTYSIGDQVEVIVDYVDKDESKIYLVLAKNYQQFKAQERF